MRKETYLNVHVSQLEIQLAITKAEGLKELPRILSI